MQSGELGMSLKLHWSTTNLSRTNKKITRQTQDSALSDFRRFLLLAQLTMEAVAHR
jgi:hypothetical protein